MRFESVIWDWNGTLLKDVDIAILVINQLLEVRDLPPLTIGRYLDVFTFPVQDYYEQIGFDLKNEPFEIPAFQFTESYTKAVESCGLYPEAIPVIRRLNDLGHRQFILSAMEQQQLEKTVYDSGITTFFEGLWGLNNHFATSKLENGHKLVRNKKLNPELTLLVGDTIHDAEVAQALRCNCVLVAQGHQSKDRLLRTGAKVVNNLNEIEF